MTNTIYDTRDIIWLGWMYFFQPDGMHKWVLTVVSTKVRLQNDGSGRITDDELESDPEFWWIFAW